MGPGNTPWNNLAIDWHSSVPGEEEVLPAASHYSVQDKLWLFQWLMGDSPPCNYRYLSILILKGWLIWWCEYLHRLCTILWWQKDPNVSYVMFLQCGNLTKGCKQEPTRIKMGKPARMVGATLHDSNITSVNILLRMITHKFKCSIGKYKKILTCHNVHWLFPLQQQYRPLPLPFRVKLFLHLCENNNNNNNNNNNLSLYSANSINYTNALYNTASYKNPIL